MKLDFKKLVEIIGVAAVVGSLLFVGLQLKLERDLSIANAYAARAESYKSDLRSSLESDSYMASREAAWNRGDRPAWWTSDLEQYVKSNNISGTEINSISLSAELWIYHNDNLYFQAQSGFFEMDTWFENVKARAKTAMSNPQSVMGGVLRAHAQEGGQERPIDSLLREVIAEIDNEH